ncbi:glycosyltransferase [Sphingobacterium gobiense]|uniref:Glycosyl transferase family 1 domain-containing protein n=1 Tax=Sphingobacterium gobiense TaxID=1382456 RepID=A0A2S9JG51_9SPHI|nr:glycosyltransferase [Sphingobacterium gobiense]PRD51917.1 hypothetical protein C5749_16590 [Sphingobacterium gobiense]
MKNKILLLTTIYPSPDMDLMNSTNVCHYFAKEWVKAGYEVQVVFNYPVYAPIVHKFAELLGKRAASVGQSYFITRQIKECKEYEMDGVSIWRAPLYKMVPKVAVRRSTIEHQVNLITSHLTEKSFKPDFIVAHFCYPHLEMIAKLKKLYQAKTAIVNHIQSLPLRKYIGPQYSEYFKEIDIWGYRSKNIKSDFEKQFGVQAHSFMCHSGVPKEYIVNEPRTFSNSITKFIYVGSLIRRKYPLAVLQGITGANHTLKYSLSYVGEGIERKKIEKFLMTADNQIAVRLWGNLSRTAVLQKLDEAECFIMISKGETFGLVYLEAMARGLITIASKGEGMDDIIEDGENGFFCESGNPTFLASVIDRINHLSIEEKQRISANAIETARMFSDEAVAVNYLRAITD